MKFWSRRKLGQLERLERQELLVGTLHGLLQRHDLRRLAEVGGVGIDGRLRLRVRRRGSAAAEGSGPARRLAPVEHGLGRFLDGLEVGPGRGQDLLVLLPRLDRAVAAGLVHRQGLPARLFLGLLGPAAFVLELGVDLLLDLGVLGLDGLGLALEGLRGSPRGPCWYSASSASFSAL